MNPSLRGLSLADSAAKTRSTSVRTAPSQPARTPQTLSSALRGAPLPRRYSISCPNEVSQKQAPTPRSCISGHIAISFAADSTLLFAVTSDGLLSSWDTCSWSLRHCLSVGARNVVCSAFSTDGRLVALGCRGDSIRVYDTARSLVVCDLPPLVSQLTALAFSPDDQLLAAAGTHCEVVVWDVDTGREFCRSEPTGFAPRAVVFDPTGAFFAVRGGGSATNIYSRSGVHVTSLADGVPGAAQLAWNKLQLQAPSPVFSFSCVSSNFSSSMEPDDCFRVNVVSATESCGFQPALTPYCASLEEVGITASSGFLPPTISSSAGPSFSEEASLIAGTSHDGTIYLWDFRKGVLCESLHGHEGPVLSLAFGDCGRLVSSSLDGTVRVWDVACGCLLETHRVPGTPRSVAVSPDLHFVASCDARSVTVWAMGSGECLADLRLDEARPE